VERGGEGISVGRGTLRGWVEGFEWQVGEGELVLFVE
jgi:hypothetical protein